MLLLAFKYYFTCDLSYHINKKAGADQHFIEQEAQLKKVYTIIEEL